MRVLETADAAQILYKHPELRLSDIPVAGMMLEGNIMISANREGEVILLDLSDEE